MVNIKFIILQILLLMMLCASVAFTNDVLDSSSDNAIIRYVILLFFPVLPWIMISSALVQYRRHLKGVLTLPGLR